MRKHNQLKSLTLSTQTVRSLSDAALDAVGGAGTLIGCNLPTRQYVNTCLKGCVQ